MHHVTQIELTSHCNATCAYCPYSKMLRPKGHMTLKTLKTVEKQYLKDLRDTDSYVVLNHFGEFFLHPKFEKMTKFLKKKGHLTETCSNGILVNKENIKRCESSLDSIVIQWNTFDDKKLKRLDLLAKSKIGYITLRQLVQQNRTEEYYKKLNAASLQVKGLYGDRVQIQYQAMHDWASAGCKVGNKVRAPFVGHVLCKAFTCNECCVLWDGTLVNCCYDYDGVDPIINKQRSKKLCSSCGFDIMAL